MSIESIGKFVMALAVVASLTVGYPQTSNAQINDKVSRNNGAPFFANQRASRTFNMREITRAASRVTPRRLKSFNRR